MRVLARVLATFTLASIGLAAGAVLLMRPVRAIASAGRADALPASVELNQFSERSVVYDRNGGVLAILHAEENRSPITLDQVPQPVINAVLDVEDDHFYKHGGFNLRSILRAALTNTQSGSVRQGGSTITQQLVKNSLLTPQRDINRKAKEAVLAVRLEQQMTKQQILEKYLNTVYFGNGAYGVQAAAETYWGITARELTVGQGAFLAGAISNPVGYDPFRHREAATARRDYALDRMVINKHLAAALSAELKHAELPSQPVDAVPTRDGYFVEEVKQALLEDPRLGESAQERYNAVFRGGLRIETTFDPVLQELAEQKVKQNLPDTKGRFTASLVTVEPSTGAVRSMVGGPGFEQAHYNLATGRGGSGRQPGSSFKTFVLLAALEYGDSPKDSINGTGPCPIKIKGIKKVFQPDNYEGESGGMNPLTTQFAHSVNCAFLRLGLSFDDDQTKSLQHVVDMAKKMGIKHKLEPLVSISLGSEEVTPLEMASAYGVIANDGVRHEPYFVEKVVDRAGKTVLTGRTKGDQVISQQVAREAITVMRGPIQSGTATKARIPGRDLAGKTGTSQEWRDAWFVGFAPQLSTAVWMGSPIGQVSMRNVGGVRVVGGTYPAKIWQAYMAEALKPFPVVKFSDPDPKRVPKAKAIKVKSDPGSYPPKPKPTVPAPQPVPDATLPEPPTSQPTP